MTSDHVGPMSSYLVMNLNNIMFEHNVNLVYYVDEYNVNLYI